MVMELFQAGCNQLPDSHNVRRSRWLVVRNVYRQLTDTTIPTFFDWFPPYYFGSYNKTEHRYNMSMPLSDGTVLDMEVLFRALDKEEHVSNLLSLEVSGAWLNEYREIPKIIFDAIDGRIGRYPPRREVGCTYPFTIMDSNPPDHEHWSYKLFEEERMNDVALYEKYQIFHQPSGLSNEAENLPYLPEGYYENLAAGKTPDFVRVYVDGQYGYVRSGKPVYQNYSDVLHLALKPLSPVKSVPIIIGMDFALNPAAAFTQFTPSGNFNVLREITGEGMPLRTFVTELLMPIVHAYYRGFRIIIIGDPSGVKRADTDGRTCFQELIDSGFHAIPAKTNAIQARFAAIDSLLTRIQGGKAVFQLDPSCTMLRKGFLGEYKFPEIHSRHGLMYAEKPLKNEFSHCFTKDTLIRLVDGQKRIKDVIVGDIVKTPWGNRKVLKAWMTRSNAEIMEINLSDGRKIKCTPDHKFILANKSVAYCRSLQYKDVLCDYHLNLKEIETWNIQSLLNLKERNTDYPTGDITGLKTGEKPHVIYTGLFGKIILGIKFLKDTLSTILIKMFLITISPILRLCPTGNTHQCTPEKDLPMILNHFSEQLKLQEKLRKNGMDLQPELSFTKSLESRYGSVKRSILRFVKYVERSIQRISQREANGVLLNVNKKQEGCGGMTMWKEYVLNVVNRLLPINIVQQKPALHVVAVNLLQETEDVYNITVDVDHVYFANDVLVFNCHDALQYAGLGYEVMDQAKGLTDLTGTIVTRKREGVEKKRVMAAYT